MFHEVVLRATERPQQPDIRYISKLFLHTFRHSQGIGLLQIRIFDYIHYIRPQWRLDGEQTRKIKEEAKNATAVILGQTGKNYPHKRIVDDGKELDKQLIFFSGALDHLGSENDIDDILNEITIDILEKDVSYLSRERGRPRRKNPKGIGLQDPFFSFYYSYVVLANSTGFSEFDEMYEDMRILIESIAAKPKAERNEDEKRILRTISEIKEVYLEKHKNLKINPQSL